MLVPYQGIKGVKFKRNSGAVSVAECNRVIGHCEEFKGDILCPSPSLALHQSNWEELTL